MHMQEILQEERGQRRIGEEQKERKQRQIQIGRNNKKVKAHIMNKL